ncbi:hypothetical protein ACTXI9_01475 [Brachybacterium alimentarium]|uniref:hypothetical protein n=1 Tax=Brachybacterium alimentarium TaxID=47845 RepID=UPI003FCFEE43
MAEYSYPVEEDPMPAKDWSSVTLGIGSGVLDEGGAPYRLININNTQNTVTVAVDSITKYAHSILRGFYHKIDENVTLSIPAVTSTTTYRIALQYDPERNSVGELPVQLDVFTSLDRTGGKEYLVLHKIVRQANQLLTDATITKVDTKIATTVIVDTADAVPDIDSVLWGTRVLVTETGEELRAGGSVGARQWITTNQRRFIWSATGNTGTYVSPGSGGGYQRALGRRGTDRRLRGSVSLASGNDFQPGQQYNIMSGRIPAADAPSALQRFSTPLGGITTTGDARVSRIEISSDGDVYAWVSAPTAWIALDGIEWEAKS